MPQVKTFIVFLDDGVAFDVEDETDAVRCALENGYTTDEYGKRWAVERHEYDDDGEPIGERPVYINWEEVWSW